MRPSQEKSTTQVQKKQTLKFLYYGGMLAFIILYRMMQLNIPVEIGFRSENIPEKK